MTASYIDSPPHRGVPEWNTLRSVLCARVSVKDRHSKIWAGALLWSWALCCGAVEPSPGAKDAQSNSVTPPKSAQCLAEGGGFVRARLSGVIKADIIWSNEGTACTGATRPSGGVRMRFSHPFTAPGQSGDGQLVLLFGIPGLREGTPAKNLPVNLTIIREGAGKFYGTRGDDKCLIETLTQTAIAGIPLRNRSYRVTAHGFCSQPARAITGEGAVLVSRFDFTGRIDYSEEDRGPETPVVAQQAK
ncbi:MAG TPA: hypothetical protein VK629_10345 [Steroidobacteraceae bacterium]|nr:hypothetical protein [Steroidobacteraceae bacterium]